MTCFSVNFLTRQTGILFGFFVSILCAVINASIFVKRANFQVVCFEGSYLRWIRSVSPVLEMSVS